MANKPNANREVILQNEVRAFQLRKMGWTQDRIADEIGMTQQGVAKALKRITARFYKDFMSDVKAIKEEQVAQLEHIADESMQAWSRSKVGSEAGDPRFLSSFMKAKEEIRKIVGANLPPNPEDDEDPIDTIRIKIIHPEVIPDDDECLHCCINLSQG